MADPSIAAGFARGLLELAASKGADRNQLLERSSISPGDLEDQDNRIPFPKYVALMRSAKALSGDPALALHFGESFDTGELSVVGQLTRSAETAAEGLALMNRYTRLILDVDIEGADRLRLVREKQRLWMVDTRSNPNEFPEATESAFARMVASGRRFFPEAPWFEAVHFTHAPPAYRAEYDRIFRTPVVFESERNGMLLDEAWASHIYATQPRYLMGILSAHAEGLLKELESSKSVRGRVEVLLMNVLQSGDASMEEIAGKLGLSGQTLYRRLKSEGVTFDQVLRDLRHKLALHLLGNRDLTVNEISYLLGFSDPASFSHAFKRWTGRGPRAVRAEIARGLQV
jgi:AraC-like DNA-binding protein